MKRDEKGNECPGTLGEYRKICATLSPFGTNCKAVSILDEMILNQSDGEASEVLTSDLNMREVLLSNCLVEHKD